MVFYTRNRILKQLWSYLGAAEQNKSLETINNIYLSSWAYFGVVGVTWFLLSTCRHKKSDYFYISVM